MQAQHNKFVPRFNAFERINAAAYDLLKDKWECDPGSMARCTDAKQHIWEINDLSMGIWVSVCFLTKYCCCGLLAHTACSAHCSMRQQPRKCPGHHLLWSLTASCTCSSASRSCFRSEGKAANSRVQQNAEGKHLFIVQAEFAVRVRLQDMCCATGGASCKHEQHTQRICRGSSINIAPPAR